MAARHHGLDGTKDRTAGATGGDRMTAVVRDSYGPPDVLQVREVDRPAPARDEVLVRVAAAGVDRGAWHLMTGRPLLLRAAGFGLRRPREPRLGTELAGVLEAVGADVRGLAVGDAVFGIGTGSFAEYAVATPGGLARTPSGLTAAQAAAVPVSGVTALQALRDQGRLQAGQTVLVIGASGGVGTFAVQIAKALGAEVTGVASTAKTDLVRALGADHVIDYTLGDLPDGVRRYDLVLDIGGNRPLGTLRRLLAPKGTLVFVGGEGGGPWSGGLDRQMRAVAVSPFVGQRLGGPWVARVTTADLDVLGAMIDEGAVLPAVDRVAALSDLPRAMRDLGAGRVRGKVVVTP